MLMKVDIQKAIPVNLPPNDELLSTWAYRCKGRPNCMRERSSRSGMASPRRLTAIKHPIPPHLRLATSFLLLYPSTQQTASFLTALLAGPGFGRPTRQLRCHLQAPSITLLSPPDPPHAGSLVFSIDHPSARCRVGGLQLTVTTMACLNPSGRRPSTDATRFPQDRHHPSSIATYH
jgi:hypothetical protein